MPTDAKFKPARLVNTGTAARSAGLLCPGQHAPAFSIPPRTQAEIGPLEQPRGAFSGGSRLSAATSPQFKLQDHLHRVGPQ